jgi:arylsulfatase A-like enzyme/lysophospholipase L1-like esterase
MSQHTNHRIKNALFVLTFTLLLSGDAISRDILRIACVGDSITAGARVDAATESYPAVLQEILGASYEVKNFGIGGATLLKTGTPNVWRSLQKVKDFSPHVVVISLGTNDTVSGNRRNWERIDAFEDDYRELIHSLRVIPSDPKIIVCTPTAMVLETPELATDRLANLRERQPRLQELCSRIRQLIEEQNDPQVTLLELNPVLSGKPSLLTPSDGVHPNVNGYAAIAQVVAAEIKPNPIQPNIVLFLVDDMGWQDTSVPFATQTTEFNRRYRTPNMERLARNGIKFTQAYACSVCSPTRVSIMTGLNAARHRVTNWTLKKNASNDRAHPTLRFPAWNVNGLSPDPGIERTVHAKALPAFLKETGYRTIHIGKAHFGAVGTPGSDPINVGFEINVGGHAAGGPGSFLASQNFSAAWRKGDRIWDIPGLDQYHGKDIFLTEALTIEANKAVDAAVAEQKPFFLYMSHYAVHVPFAEDSRYYESYRKAGLDHTEAMYAAMVQGMDQSLGDIMSNLERHGLTDETIILFISDNGGLSASGRGGTPHTHNRPLSSGKGSAHEGGTRVPMIVSWPGVTLADSVCDQPVIVEDFFPTILELAGVQNITQVGGTIDGKSFFPLIRGQSTVLPNPRPLYWHFPNHWGPKGPGIGPSSSIREGDWKLIYYHETQSYELFDLANDLPEQRNLAEAKPGLRDNLARQLRDYLITVDAQMPIQKSSGLPVPYPAEQTQQSE